MRRNNGTLYFQPDFEEYGDNHEENENVKYNLKCLSDCLSVVFGVGFLSAAFIFKVSPRVKNWWQISAKPISKERWRKFRKKERINFKKLCPQ